MRIKIQAEQTDTQVFMMVKTLMKSCKGMEFDGITARVYFSDVFGIEADHHLYTDVMDVMTRTNEAKLTQGWGFTKYIIL